MTLDGSHYRLANSTTDCSCYTELPIYQWTIRTSTPLSQPHTTRGHSKQLQLFQPEVDALKYTFLPRTILECCHFCSRGDRFTGSVQTTFEPFLSVPFI